METTLPEEYQQMSLIWVMLKKYRLAGFPVARFVPVARRFAGEMAPGVSLVAVTSPIAILQVASWG
jgi:hypothetical protein